MSDSTQERKTVAEQHTTIEPQTADGRAIETESVTGGHLVFADCDGVGRELIGFADVDEWALVRQALAKRGLGVGAVHNLETYAPEEVGL